MSGCIPDHAFVLAAGLGTRLRPHTDTLPKPLVPVNGRPLLDYIFDHLKEAGVRHVTVNLHHKPDPLRAFLQTRTDLAITQSFEDSLLDTGSGVKKVLPTLGSSPFYVINGDAFWLDGPGESGLRRLATAFDPARMDILLLLQPVSRMALTGGVGDYDLTAEGIAIRNRTKNGTHMFAGIRLCGPGIFSETPEGKFSFLELMDKAESAGRLFGLEHEGDWHHISTPEDLAAVDRAISQG
jgi:MurNAc alpha-1-phosphate uridylyltransferase